MQNIIESLKAAIEMEHEGHDLYVQAAEKTSNKLGKETLFEIAKKELDHIAAIKEFIKQVSGENFDIDKATQKINPITVKDYIIPIMKKLKKKLHEKIKADSDLENAYKVAMGLEKESYNLYNKLSKETDDQGSRKFFEFLMGEENNHYELLQDTLEYLNDPGEWFKKQERWIVEG
jgi:rubrerythrin